MVDDADIKKSGVGREEVGYTEIELSAHLFCDPKAFIKMTNQNSSMGW